MATSMVHGGCPPTNSTSATRCGPPAACAGLGKPSQATGPSSRQQHPWSAVSACNRDPRTPTAAPAACRGSGASSAMGGIVQQPLLVMARAFVHLLHTRSACLDNTSMGENAWVVARVSAPVSSKWWPRKLPRLSEPMRRAGHAPASCLGCTEHTTCQLVVPKRDWMYLLRVNKKIW